jgi:hypothetical protein
MMATIVEDEEQEERSFNYDNDSNDNTNAKSTNDHSFNNEFNDEFNDDDDDDYDDDEDDYDSQLDELDELDDDDDDDDNDSIRLRFLLPDDAEFKFPWRAELRLAPRRTVGEVKARLCVRLKVSNEARFQLQTTSGTFPENSTPLAQCLPRASSLLATSGRRLLFVVRRDVTLRVQAAVAERLSSILTPRAGGTTSSIDDDDTSSTLMPADKELPSASAATTASISSPRKAVLVSTPPVAATAVSATSAAAVKKKSVALLTSSAERPAGPVVKALAAPHAAAIAAIASSGEAPDAPGVLVEFLFPPGLLAFNNLQKKSMRSLPTAPMSLIKAALVAKCAPTAPPAEQARLVESIELQSMTGVLFRDNDTLSENFFLDQHCVVTLVVREVVGRGFSGRKAPLSQRQRRPRQQSAPGTAPPTDVATTAAAAKKDKGAASSPRSQPTSPKTKFDALKASPSRTSELGASSSTAASTTTTTTTTASGGVVVRVRHRRRTNERELAPQTPVKKGVSSPNRVGLPDVPRLNLSPRRSDNSVANNNDNFPRPQSARAVMAALPFDLGADDSRATVVACFYLPPSEAFHGLEKKLMAIGAFDTAGQIKRQLFEAIRCQSSADDYELRTRANRSLEVSGTTLLAGGEPPKSPRRASPIAAPSAMSQSSRGGLALSPRRAGPLVEMTAALERESTSMVRQSPGESYFDISMADGGSSTAEVASPRRVTGRAYAGHVFADSERLADFFKMDHFEGIDLELVAKGSTFKPLAVTHIPLPSKNKSAPNVNDATPTSLASALSLQALSSVLPVDDILAGRKRVLVVNKDGSTHHSSATTDDNDADALSSADTDNEAAGTSTPPRRPSDAAGTPSSYAEAIRLAKAENRLRSPRTAVDAVIAGAATADSAKLSSSSKSPSSPAGSAITPTLGTVASKVKKKSASSPAGKKSSENRKSGFF